MISKFVTDDGVTILRLSGKLIASSLDPLKTSLDTILEEDGKGVVLNLKLINIIDSVAVGLLVSRFKTAQKKEMIFRFCELQPAIRRLLSLADLDKWLEIYDSEDEALEGAKIKE